MWHLATLTQDVSICFRCQYRLATKRGVVEHRLKRRKVLVRPFGTTNISSQQAAPAYVANNERSRGKVYACHIPPLANLDRPEILLPRGLLSERPLVNSAQDGNSGYEYRHLPIEAIQSQIVLDVESLGERASILRIPDKGLAKRRTKKPHAQSPGVALPSPSAQELESMTEFVGQITGEESLELIEAVRVGFLSSLDPAAPPKDEDCQKVIKQLSNEFSLDQLESYLAQTTVPGADDILDLQGLFVDDICWRSRWYHGETAFPDNVSTRLQGQGHKRDTYVIGHGPSKASEKHLGLRGSIAEKILRKSWRLRSQEEIMQAGEVDMKLAPEPWIHLRDSECSTDIFEWTHTDRMSRIWHHPTA